MGGERRAGQADEDEGERKGGMMGERRMEENPLNVTRERGDRKGEESNG